MKTTKFLLPTLIAAAAMTATAYAEDTVLTYDNLFSSEDGWSLGSLRGRTSGVFSLDTTNQTLSVTNSNWGQAYATYELGSRITATEGTALEFSFDFSEGDTGMYGLALVGSSQTFCVGMTYGSSDFYYGSTTDVSSTVYGFGSWGSEGYTQVSGSAVSGLSVATGTTYTVSGVVSYVNNLYSLSLTAGDATVTYDLGDSFDVSKLVFAADGPNNSSNVSFSNLSLSGAKYTVFTWIGGESGNWSDDSWTDGASTGLTISVDSDVAFDSSVVMTAAEDVSLYSLTVVAGNTLTLAGEGTVSSGSLNNSGTISVGTGSALNVASVTALGAITGSGKIVFGTGDVAPGDNFTAETWTGTVAFENVTKAGLKVSDFGNTSSTVEFDNFTGYFAEGNNGTISSNVSIVNGLTINDGWSGKTLTFAGAVSGDSFNYTKGNTQSIKFTNTVDLDSASLLGATANFEGATATIGTLNLGSATVNVSNVTTAIVENLYFGGASGADTSTISGNLTVTGNVAQASTGQVDNEVLALAENASLTIDGTLGTTVANANDGSQVSYVLNIGNGASLSANTIAQANDLDVTLGTNATMSAEALTLNAFWGAKTHTFTGASSDTSVISAKGISLTNANSNLSVSTAKVLVGANGISGSGSMTLTDAVLGVQDAATSWSSSVAMTLGGATTTDAGYGKSISLDGVLSGSGSLIKTGEGMLTLSSANTYSGGTTISAGTLVVANANALGDAGGAVTISGGQLSVSQNVTLAQTAITIVLSNAYNTENSEKIAAISGAGAFADGTTITLDKAADAVALSLVAEAPQKYSYQIFDPTSSLVGTDWTFELGSAWDGWAQSYDTTSGVLTLTIPEPSAFGLLAGVGALALVVSRRKRRK